MINKNFGSGYVKNGANDKVYTPEHIAKKIIDLYNINGLILDASSGKNKVFYNNYPKDCKKDWCEIELGKDFFNYNKKVDWIITNPPYSIFDEFLKHSQELSDNIVFLIPLSKAVSSMKRIRTILKYGNIVSIDLIPASKCGFPFGFPACSFYIKKGYKGNTKIKELYNKYNE